MRDHIFRGTVVLPGGKSRDDEIYDCKPDGIGGWSCTVQGQLTALLEKVCDRRGEAHVTGVETEFTVATSSKKIPLGISVIMNRFQEEDIPAGYVPFGVHDRDTNSIVFKSARMPVETPGKIYDDNPYEIGNEAKTIVLLGPSGVGKTTTLKKIIKDLKLHQIQTLYGEVDEDEKKLTEIHSILDVPTIIKDFNARKIKNDKHYADTLVDEVQKYLADDISRQYTKRYHILPTPMNKDSSRCATFYTFKDDKGEPNIQVVDAPGTEDEDAVNMFLQKAQTVTQSMFTTSGQTDASTYALDMNTSSKPGKEEETLSFSTMLHKDAKTGPRLTNQARYINYLVGYFVQAASTKQYQNIDKVKVVHTSTIMDNKKFQTRVKGGQITITYTEKTLEFCDTQRHKNILQQVTDCSTGLPLPHKASEIVQNQVELVLIVPSHTKKDLKDVLNKSYETLVNFVNQGTRASES